MTGVIFILSVLCIVQSFYTHDISYFVFGVVFGFFTIAYFVMSRNHKNYTKEYLATLTNEQLNAIADREMRANRINWDTVYHIDTLLSKRD
jgi:dolichol kinase